MQYQPILGTEKESESGIASTVRLYVRLKNISALSKMKVQRLEWISQHTDTEAFDSTLFREHCQRTSELLTPDCSSSRKTNH